MAARFALEALSAIGVNINQQKGTSGFTTIGYGPIAAASAHHQMKQIKYANRIGDELGAQVSKVRVVEHSFFSAASFAIIPVRIIDLVRPIVTVGQAAMQGFYTVFAAISSIGYAISYLVTAGRFGHRLSLWSDGSAWRERLLKSDDPVLALKQELDTRVHESGKTADDYKALALDAGERWIKKVIKEGKEQEIALDIDDSRKAFELYVEKNPQLVDAVVGRSVLKLSGEQQLIRLGKHLHRESERAKFEQEKARLLGDTACAALQKSSTAEIKEALSSTKDGWYFAARVALGVIGAVAVVAGLAFTGAIPVAVALGLMAVASLIMVCTEDFQMMKDRIANIEIGSWDRPLIAFRFTLSLVAVMIMVSTAILTGGATVYIGALIFMIGVLFIACKEVHMLFQHDFRPWDFQKIPSIEAFHALVKTNADQEKLLEVFNRMSSENQEWIQRIPEGKTLLTALDERQEAIQEQYKRSLEALANSLSTLS